MFSQCNCVLLGLWLCSVYTTAQCVRVYLCAYGWWCEAEAKAVQCDSVRIGKLILPSCHIRSDQHSEWRLWMCIIQVASTVSKGNEEKPSLGRKCQTWSAYLHPMGKKTVCLMVVLNQVIFSPRTTDETNTRSQVNGVSVSNSIQIVTISLSFR